MDVVLMVLYIVIVLSVLVFIHEGGHFLAARAFGVRVTEFMLGLPGPNIGFTWRGTKFGVTPFLLGGYAKVWWDGAGRDEPHLEPVLAALYRRGTANMEDIARDCGIPDEDTLKRSMSWWTGEAAPVPRRRTNTTRIAPQSHPLQEADSRGA